LTSTPPRREKGEKRDRKEKREIEKRKEKREKASYLGHGEI
jgi:hypothetical protein